MARKRLTTRERFDRWTDDMVKAGVIKVDAPAEKPVSHKDEVELIRAITKRAVALAAAIGREIEFFPWFMDIENTHKISPLDLQGLLDADDENFSHDVFGIYRHFNRVTLTLDDCFAPRYSKKEQP